MCFFFPRDIICSLSLSLIHTYTLKFHHKHCNCCVRNSLSNHVLGNVESPMHFSWHKQIFCPNMFLQVSFNIQYGIYVPIVCRQKISLLHSKHHKIYWVVFQLLTLWGPYGCLSNMIWVKDIRSNDTDSLSYNIKMISKTEKSLDRKRKFKFIIHQSIVLCLFNMRLWP